MPTKNQVLKYLPPYEDKWVLVKKDQYVPDIITEICESQVLFMDMYDCFSFLFKDRNPDVVAEDLVRFCKREIAYSEETVEDQTSAVPQGILIRGHGDCKHYALFCGGVLSSLNRLQNAGIDWWFCFASYIKSEKVPYHVFVALQDGDTEVWLDPTPGAGEYPKHLYKRYV